MPPLRTISGELIDLFDLYAGLAGLAGGALISFSSAALLLAALRQRRGVGRIAAEAGGVLVGVAVLALTVWAVRYLTLSGR